MKQDVDDQRRFRKISLAELGQENNMASNFVSQLASVMPRIVPAPYILFIH